MYHPLKFKFKCQRESFSVDDLHVMFY